MAPDPQAIRVRLEELLDDVQEVNTQLVEPLDLNETLSELQQTIDVYQTLEQRHRAGQEQGEGEERR